MKDSNKKKQEKSILTFLKETKKGKYAKIEESSMKYTRIKEQSEMISPCSDIYYYNIH